MQSVKEAVSEKTIFVQDDIVNKLSLIKLNVTNFAFESIKSELIGLMLSNSDSTHESQVKPGERCLCSLRKNFRLPCRHILKQYESSSAIPLSAVHQRWRIAYLKGTGKYFYKRL